MTKAIKIIDAIIDFAGVLASICIFFICFFVTWGVIARYFHIAAHWVEPTTIYMFIAATFLTISITMKNNEHVRVDILTSKLSPFVNKILDTSLMVIFLVFFAFVTKSVFQMLQNSYAFQTKDLSIIQVPVWIPQACMFIGCSIFLLSIVRYIWSIWYEEQAEVGEQ